MPTEKPTTPDPNADYWSIADVAVYFGVTEPTIRTYRSRNRGELPPQDNLWGQSPVWKPQTIINFRRPGQGARTDRRPSDGPRT